MSASLRPVRRARCLVRVRQRTVERVGQAGQDHATSAQCGPHPEIREEVNLNFEVLIDAYGQHDLKTLKVTGKGSGSSHAAIEDWIRSSTFKPAIQDGHPVTAVYRGGLKSKITARRP